MLSRHLNKTIDILNQRICSMEIKQTNFHGFFFPFYRLSSSPGSFALRCIQKNSRTDESGTGYFCNEAYKGRELCGILTVNNKRLTV